MSHSLPSAFVAQPTGLPVGVYGQGRFSRRRIAVVGAGRVGTILARELARAGHDVRGPLARDYGRGDIVDAEIVLLCVPDREIAPAAAAWRARRGTDGRTPLLGHCSGASGLDVLRDPGGSAAEQLFSLHPLMTFADAAVTPRWTSAAAAVAASSAAALAMVAALAEDLGLAPIEVPDEDRVAYHAAASIASNFLVTLESAAEALAGTAGVSREMLAPLVRETVENWARDGAAALTGPIARGDEETVRRQRDAIVERVPRLVALFDALAEATRATAAPGTRRGDSDTPPAGPRSRPAEELAA